MIALSGLITAAYAYDGNQLSGQVDGETRTLTWSSYNKPIRIEQGGTVSELGYDPERTLVRQIDIDGQGSTTTVRIGPWYEKITSTSEVTHRYHIGIGGATKSSPWSPRPRVVTLRPPATCTATTSTR